MKIIRYSGEEIRTNDTLWKDLPKYTLWKHRETGTETVKVVRRTRVNNETYVIVSTILGDGAFSLSLEEGAQIINRDEKYLVTEADSVVVDSLKISFKEIEESY